MQIQSILNILYDNMPKFSDKFTDQLDVDTVACDNAGLVTVVCNTPHGLETGNNITAVGFENLNEVKAVNGDVITLDYPANIVNTDDIETVTFQTAGSQPFLEITQDGLEITLDNGFTAPSVGDFLLDNFPRFWVNGTYVITVVDANTFTYQVESNQASSFTGGKIHCRHRIYGSITGDTSAFDNVQSSTSFSLPKLMILPLEITTSKSRYNNNDATNWDTAATSNKNTIIRNFAVVVLQDITDELNSIEIYDEIDSIDQQHVLSCLFGQYINFPEDISTVNYLGAIFDEALNENSRVQMQFAMNFEYQTELTYDNIREEQGTIIRNGKIDIHVDEETVTKQFV